MVKYSKILAVFFGGFMKKIIFLVLFSSLLLNPVAAMSESDQPAVDLEKISKAAQDLKNKSEQQTKLQKVVSKLSSISAAAPAKVKATFNWVADHIDTILTKKGAIKTLLILGPLFSIYCCIFPPAPVQALIRYIIGPSVTGGAGIATETLRVYKDNKEGIKPVVVDLPQEVGEVQATIKINQEIGELKALMNSLFSSNGGWTIGLGLYNVLNRLITAGAPFALGLFMQEAVKISSQLKLDALKKASAQ